MPLSTVTIANGQTVSDALDLSRAGFSLVGIVTPAALTGATFTFQASADGVTYNAVYDKTGALVSVTVAASRYVVLAPADFAGIAYLKVVSGSTEGGARTIGLVARPV